MKMNQLTWISSILTVIIAACTSISGEMEPIPQVEESTPFVLVEPVNMSLPVLSIKLEDPVIAEGITLNKGGDVDTQMLTKGDPMVVVHTTGNMDVINADDNNSIPDSYIQFDADDTQLFSTRPSSHLRIEVDYYDEGSDSFFLEYDSVSGPFAGAGAVQKTNTLGIKTALFNICDASFSNRVNGGDFRIADNADGPEYILAVRVIALADVEKQEINVDDFGADPFDDLPDSDAIQIALDSTCSGDTIVFTSGVSTPDYKGYLIDKTLFLTGLSAKSNLTFTSSDEANHAKLHATADLKGYVVRLFARSRVSNPGRIDGIDFGFIDINGGRDLRTCLGPDQQPDGMGDNYGSWLPECSVSADAWCMPGNLGMDGAMNPDDLDQNYLGRPDEWSTGIVVHDLVNEDAECGTALAFGSAGGRIENVIVNTAGDHVHGYGCALTDNDGDKGAWSDGITLFGPGHVVTNNIVINPSDIGIVFFGGQNTEISGNQIQITSGNYGAFGGIAIHPWTMGDISGLQITGNRILSEGDQRCGGLHTGIDLGTHMWSGGCLSDTRPAQVGNPGSCVLDPSMDQVTNCDGGKCQLWAYLPEGSTLTLKDNTVTGAHINYLIGGLAMFGEFIDENNVSLDPQRSDWYAATYGCNGRVWGPLDKAAHSPVLTGYTDLIVHCER